MSTASKYTLFPIKNRGLWELYKKAESSFWRAEEVSLDGDLKGWQGLTPGERHFIETVLAFFACADGIVADNLITRFTKEIGLKEAEFFYGFQVAMENIHTEMYALLLDTYTSGDAAKREKLLSAVENNAAIKAKADWALKWLNSGRTLGERLVAFAAVEGIFFSSSFCAIFFMGKRNTLPGLRQSNEFISRDEALHCDFACALLGSHIVPPKRSIILEIVKSAVECEIQFVRECLPLPLIGMNADLMTQYVKFVADDLLFKLKAVPFYKVDNPFPFMNLITLEGKNNFFEKRVTEYAKADIKEFCTSSDF